MKSFLIIMCLGYCPFGQAYQVIGHATTNNGKFAYTEIHQVALDTNGFNQSVTSSYFNEKNELFAKMNSKFGSHLFLPITDFEDMRSKHKFLTKFDDLDKTYVIQAIEPGKSIKEKRLVIDANMIAGQGFDNYIRKNFDFLKKEKKEIKFIVIPKLDFFAFSVESQKNNESVNSKKTSSFQISPDSLLIRLFVKTIQVLYEEVSGRLMRYQGLSNIDDANGNSQVVDIQYDQSKP
ncbi:MAG: hypothetical protein WA160_02830 [Pseudobdellovibrio sp.]